MDSKLDKPLDDLIKQAKTAKKSGDEGAGPGKARRAKGGADRKSVV